MIKLPGAEIFSQYLEEMLGGVLTAEGPEIVDRSYNGEYGKRWIIRRQRGIIGRILGQRGELIGEYFTFGPEPAETEFGREFRGRILGYVNECVGIHNQGRPTAERMPIASVHLIYANQRFEAQPMDEGPGILVDTPWQRQDGHDMILFP